MTTPQPYTGQGPALMNGIQREKANHMVEVHGHPLEERMEGNIAILICNNFRSRWAILSDGQQVGSGFNKRCKDFKQGS